MNKDSHKKQDEPVENDKVNLRENLASSDDDYQKKKTLADIFHISRHKKIEHLTLIFLAASTTFVGSFTASCIMGYKHEAAIAQQTTSLSDKLAFSKTDGASVTLKPIVKSKDEHTAYVPFSVSDMSNLPTNANKYKTVIVPKANGDGQKLKAELVVFGATGNMCIKISSNSKIEPSTLQAVIRDNSKMSNSASGSDDQLNSEFETNDATLEQLANQYDILTFAFNPGATKGGGVSKKTVTDDASLYDVYDTCFLSKQRDTIKKDIKHQKQIINQNLAAAKDYRERLEALGYEVPKDPDFVKNDWRPFNTVDPKTGKMKDGSNVSTQNIQNQNSDSPDAQALDNLPQYLPNKRLGNNAMQNATNQMTNDTDVNDNSTATNNTDAATIWSNLQNTWTNVLSAKQQIYVTDNAQLYNLKQLGDSVEQSISVSNSKHAIVSDGKKGL